MRLPVLVVGACPCCLPRGWHHCWLCSPRFAFPMLYFPRPRLAFALSSCPRCTSGPGQLRARTRTRSWMRMRWTRMRISRLVAYGVLPDLRNVFTVALTAAHSAHSAQASSRIHPCVKAASHLPCARPPDGAYRLEYQGQLPKENLLLLDLRRPFGAHILSRPRGRPLHGGLSRRSSAHPGHALRARRPVPAPFSGPVIGRC